MIIIKNNAKRLVKISFLSLFIPFVANASSVVDYLAASYGYTYTDTGGTTHSYTWSGYNTNYVQRSLSDFPATYNDEGLKIKDFGIRFRIDGGFKKDHNYIITLQWENYSSDYPSLPNYNWYDVYTTMPKTWTCRTDSWSGTSQSESTCFYSDSHSEPSKVSQSTTLINFYVNPKIDMYGFTIYWENSNYYYSEGWSLIASYTEVTDESQAIIDNATQNTQNIINNQNTNTQNIINNQNQNAQAIIDSNQSCDLIDKNQIVTTGKALNSSGIETASSVAGITGYISISSSARLKKVALLSDASKNYCFYNVNKTLISCASTTTGLNEYITIPDNASFVRFTIRTDLNIPTYQLCKNGSQAVVDAITDSTPPDSSPIANATGWLPAGPVDSILNLPLTLMNSISNVITSGVCQPITIDLPHIINAPLVLPCMSTVWANIGVGNFFTWFGRIIGGIILYRYLLRLYKWVDDTLTMRENNNFDDGSMG